jgi:hypothetical protein
VTAHAWSDCVKKNPAEHSALKRENGTNQDEEKRNMILPFDRFHKSVIGYCGERRQNENLAGTEAFCQGNGKKRHSGVS